MLNNKGDYVISCCSTADRTAEFFEERNILCISFHFHFGDESYDDDFWNSMSCDEFYTRLKKGDIAVTSQVNSEEFIENWKPILEAGKDIIHVTLSSGITGVLNSANIAAEELREEFPDRKIYVVDSLSASGGFGLLVEYMANLRDKGMALEDLYEWTEKNKRNFVHWFFSTDLTSFIRGGRVSAASGYVGMALGICPLLHVDDEGKLIPVAKIRTKKKVIKAIVDKMLTHAKDGADYHGIIGINYSGTDELAKRVYDLVKETFPKAKAINYDHIGPVIGAHTGIGTVALFFYGDGRGTE